MELPINKIICGDSLEVLKTLPDDCIDMCITSPPYYGLRNYGVEGQLGLEKTFEEYLKKILEITKEIKRVLKPTGSFWLNMGDCYGGSMLGYGAKEKSKTGIQSPAGIDKRFNSEKSRLADMTQKCMLMQPERLAIKMIDEQGWILRNKIKWAKQVLIKKQNKTIGSVMPTSVKDRFNESGEELYFFVKSKKYYSDLDAVRLPNQVIGVSDFRENRGGFVDPKELYDSKFNKFNYRVRDAKRKAGQPQFKASEEEINRYGKGSEYEQKYGEPWDRFGKNTKKANSERQKDAKKEGMHTFYTHSKRNSAKKLKSRGVPATYIGATCEDHNLLNNPTGKNLPTIWQIQSEPHNFQKELGVDVDHFAIFPKALVEIPIKFSTKPGDVVLDPFSGSGTVAVVARSLRRNYIGIELSREYIAISNKRLAQEILL